MSDDARDAARYRALRALMDSAVGVEMDCNYDALQYDPVNPAERVSLTWYPITPVGSIQITGPSLDAVLDEYRAAHTAILPPEGT